MKIRFLWLVLLFLFFTGCATVPKPTKSEGLSKHVEEQSAKAAEGPAEVAQSKPAKPQVEELTLPKYEHSREEKILPQAEPVDSKKLALEDKPVMINVESMPLSDFIVFAIGDTLKVTFFMDEPVKNTKTPVTLRMTKEMPAERALEIAVEILRQNDLIVEERAGALYILKSKPAPKQSFDVRVGTTVPDSPATITQIVHIKHLNAAELANLMTDIYKQNVITRVYYKENALMLTGPASTIRDMLSFIELMDVPYLSEKKPFLVQLTYWQPDEFIKQITTILQGLGFTTTTTPNFPGILFIPIKYLNSVLIIAPDDNTMKVILDWKNRLDSPESAGTEEKAFIFTPKYSRASDLVDSVKRLYGIAPAPAPRREREAPAAPSPYAMPGQTVVPPATQPATPATGVSVANIPGMKISADDRRNVVLIIATPSAYKGILSILQELDQTPKQVLLEVTIAELTLDDELRYGLEWFIKSKLKKNGNTGTSTASTLTGTGLGGLGLNTGSGLAYQFVFDNSNLQALMDLFASENKVNILSSPRLLVTDNQEATIQIGTDVPITLGSQTISAIGTPSTTTAQSIQYRRTGLTLGVKPTINTAGLLVLELNLDSSKTLGSGSTPQIQTRTLSTTVVASTNQTILLGGLIEEDVTNGETKVPLLGDIPLLGNLFKNTSRTKSKDELLIMIKPVITTSTDEVVRMTDELKHGMKWLK